MAVSARRAVMTLYSSNHCPYSHRVRIALLEKNVTADIIGLDEDYLPVDLMDLNPYNSVPTLVDRDMVLFNSRIIMEYLDERYPHPPLLPIDPVNRAQSRLFLYRIERDWYSLVDVFKGDDEQAKVQARVELRDGLTAVAPIFEQKPFFMNDEFSLVDCSLAPVLWRLPSYGVVLPPQAKPLLKYAESVFSRASFQKSLSNVEKTMEHL